MACSTHKIHLLTPIAGRTVRRISDIEHLKSNKTFISHSVLDHGPLSIQCEADEAAAEPGVIEKAIEAERNGASAIIIDCMGDPGLEAARGAIKTPVLGPAEVSMRLATMLGQKFSIVTVLESVKPLLIKVTRRYDVEDKLASIRYVNVPVLEIEQRRTEVQALLAEEALLAVRDDGANVIILGCTGFLGCAEVVRLHLRAANFDVPVIDPIPAAFCVAEAMANSGLLL